MMIFWFTLLMSPGYISLGMLGPIFGLSVSKSIGLTVIATAAGSVVPAFTATLCPALGLRQIAASRYAFGIWGSKFCGFLNIAVNIGFGTINCIVAGQLLRAVSDDTISDVAGIVIVLAGSYIISFFGFRIIHLYESVAWVLIFVLLLCDYGLSARYYSPTPGLSYVTGLDETGSALSYFAIIFGGCAAWCSMSGDYYIHYPTNTNKWMIFSMTWTGLAIPTMFVAILGNLLGGAVSSNEEMGNVYETGGFGALIVATMRPTGFAKFVGVMYALSFSTSRHKLPSFLHIQLLLTYSLQLATKWPFSILLLYRSNCGADILWQSPDLSGTLSLQQSALGWPGVADTHSRALSVMH